MEIATSTDQWWWSLVHTSSDADRRPADRRRATAGRSQSTPAQNRRRYASRGIRSRRPKSSARLCRGIPCDTACFVEHAGMTLCRAGFRDRSVARRPSPVTGPNRKIPEVRVAMVAGNTLLKFFFRQMLDQLREHGAARVHSALFHPARQPEKVDFGHFQLKSFSLRPCVIMLIFNGLGWPTEILAGQ